MALTPSQLDALVDLYRQKKRLSELFLGNVESYFSTDVALNTGIPTVVHSLRKRLKDEEHLREKLKRKSEEGRVITVENLFSEITDLAGLRVLHLHQDQFGKIDAFVRRKVKSK